MPTISVRSRGQRAAQNFHGTGLHFDDVPIEAEENRPVERVIAREKLVQIPLSGRRAFGCHSFTLTTLMTAESLPRLRGGGKKGRSG